VTTLAAYLHTLDPFLVRFTPDLGVRWYGLSYAAGFILAWLLLRFLSRRGVTPLSEARITDAMLALCLGVILGGRLGYVFFYDTAQLTHFSPSFPFWGALMINQGGMSSHGGMIGVVIACWFIARGPRDKNGVRSQRVTIFHAFDLTGFAAPVGLMLGRLANFINGELLGRIVAQPGEPSPWWSVKYPQEINSGHDPALTLEQAAKLGGLIDRFRLPDGDMYDATQRMITTLQSGTREESARVAAELAPLLSARHPSQLYQAATEGLLLGVVLLVAWMKPRRAGTIGGLFLVIYGVSRIATEFFRLPDAHLAVQRFAGLSRGQWLSVMMILAGVGFFVYAKRANLPFFPGWWRKASPPPASHLQHPQHPHQAPQNTATQTQA
jgi:phosphatidylglycerol:prolipoprotein diacylglycerol transferase